MDEVVKKLAGALKGQWEQGKPYRDAAVGLFQGNSQPIRQLLNQKSQVNPMTPETAMNIALDWGPMALGTITAKSLKNLPLNKNAYTAKSMGSMGQQVLFEGNPVGVTHGKLKSATDDFVKELSDALKLKSVASDKAKKAALVRARNKASKQMLEEFYLKNKDLIDNFHKNPELSFTPLPNKELFNNGKFIYQSPNYGKKAGSSYRLIDVDGMPAYARQSDHWGNFSARSADNFDKWNDYNWTLPTAANGERQTGYILLEDFLKNMK